jgi:CheY-like chemotaxis protein
MMEPPQKAAPEGEGGDLARAVHELNNLLAVMQGYAEGLSRAVGEDENCRRQMEALMEALQRSNGVARRISALARGRKPEEEGAAEAAQRGSVWGTETVLLVDDEEALRAVTGRFLGMNGYKVLEAGNAGEAVAAFERAGRVDVLVTDLMMPGVSGVDLARTLRERKPDLRVLYLSGHDMQQMKEHAGGAPGTGCLTKPFRPKDLLVRLRDILDVTPGDG